MLIARVHPGILRSEDVPRNEKGIWHDRYQITNLAEHLYLNGTCIIKVFLHLSKVEQKKRFQARIDEPHKSWKFSLADIKERGFWSDYMKAYEECLETTSTNEAPWYIVPATAKKMPD